MHSNFYESVYISHLTILFWNYVLRESGLYYSGSSGYVFNSFQKKYLTLKVRNPNRHFPLIPMEGGLIRSQLKIFIPKSQKLSQESWN